MACLDENQIVELFGEPRGRLPEAEASALDAHLAECGECRALVAAIAEPAARSEISEAPVTDPDLGADLLLGQTRRRLGTRLRDRWTLDAIIGSGGMSHVFAATHRNGRKVAVKMLRTELSTEPSIVRRFLREGYVANKIGHPGAVAVLDDDITEDGAPFLVMELLEGESLGHRLERSGAVPIAEALRIADEILAVFEAAHRNKVVHRDIKPDNLFLTRDGRVKVLDFGIARLRDSFAHETHTQSGILMGTPGFMPPEQAFGRTDEIDARTDVWALGATIYAMITGNPLRRASTPQEILLLAMTKPVPPTRTLDSRLPYALASALDRALAFDAKDRFADAGAFRDALAQLKERAEPLVLQAPARWRAPVLVGMTLLGFGTLALGAKIRARPPPTVDASIAEPSVRPVASIAPEVAAPEVLSASPSPAAVTSALPVRPRPRPRSSSSLSMSGTPPPEPPPVASPIPTRDPLGPRH